MWPSLWGKAPLVRSAAMDEPSRCYHMKIEWKTCLRVGASAFALFLCINYWPAITGFLGAALGAAVPLLMGCVMAYVLNILMTFYERHYFPGHGNTGVLKSRRPVCLTASLITLAATAAVLIRLVVPELAASVGMLAAQVPGAVNSLLEWLTEREILTQELFTSMQSMDWQSKLQQIGSVILNGAGSVMGITVNVVSSVVSGVVTAVVGLIFALYLLTGKERLAGQCDRVLRRYAKESVYTKLKYVLSVLDDCFRRYIVGQCTEAVILGVLCAVGMALLRLPYAAMIGSVIAFTALIPVAGAYIGGAVGVFLVLMESPTKAVIFLIFLIILQQLEGNLIYPRVVGTSMGLPAIWVLAAVTIGCGVMGIAGMLLGVPLATALYRLLREDVNGKGLRAAKETEEE